MRLFRVEQTGYGVQSFRVFGNNSPSESQTFLVGEGNHLLTIDNIVDFAGGSLRFATSVPGEAGSPRTTPARRPEMEKLLREHD